jgi:GAF domain-containing protein/HAMP domain-containing protein
MYDVLAGLRRRKRSRGIRAMTAQAIARDTVAEPGAPARRFGRAPLAVKLAIAFLGLVAFVLIVNGAIDTWLTYNQAKRAALEVEEEKARGAAERVGAFLNEIQTELGWTAGVEWGYAKLEQQRYDFIRLLRQAPAITALSYIDGHGKEQIAVSRLEPDSIGGGKDFSGDPRFVRAVADKIWFGPVEFRRGSEPYMTIALAHVGKTPGVTVADVNLKLVWDVVSAIHVGEKGFAYVVDDRGRLIAHPDLSLVLRDSDLSHLPQVAMALSKQHSDEMSASRVGSAETATSLDGAPVLTAYAIAPKTHWVVFVEQPLAEALATAYRSLARSLALLGLGLLLAAVSGVALARRMAAPIRLLQQGAEKLRAGDLSQRLDIRTGDEIEALAGSFNRMAGSLQESYETLEAKVEARTRDLEESLERQTATSKILEVIASSPADASPVFAAIATSANAVVHGYSTTVLRIIEDRVHLMAWTPTTPEADAALRASFPAALAEFSPYLQLRDGRVYQVEDTEADDDPRIHDIARARGFRSMIFAPLVQKGRTIGVIGVTRKTAGSFTPADVALLRAFADQAVIAIENARLFEELRARTRDVEESLAQQTATADVLKAISRSAFDLETVLETLVSTAVRLCDATSGGQIFRRHGDVYRYAASRMEVSPVYREHEQAAEIRAGRGTLIGRVALEKQAVKIDDAWSDPEYDEKEAARVGNVRAMLGVPLMRDGEPIGAFALARPAPVPFTKRQVELVTTFADQAVIAIENVRLFDEVQARTRDLEDSLERQKATSKILEIIASSPSDAEPVFRAIAASANTVSGGHSAAVFRFLEDTVHLVAFTSTTPEADSALQKQFPTALKDFRSFVLIKDGSSGCIEDTEADSTPSQIRNLGRSRGYRSIQITPLMNRGAPIGAISVTRREPGSFAPNDVQQLRAFADQAVIAIENARLFEEVQEALRRQTATSNILGVIAASPTNLDLVLGRLAQAICELCLAGDATVLLLQGDKLHRAGHFGPIEPADVAGRPINRDWVAGRAIVDGQPVHVPDLEAAVDEFPAAAGKSGFARDPASGRMRWRAIIAMPLRREAQSIGVVVLRRVEPIAFSEAQVALLRTFCDQALIAIQNARLFAEVQARTRDLEESLAQQTSTAEVLKVISRSAFDLDAIFQTLVTTAVDLCKASSGTLCVRDGDAFRYRGMAGPEATLALQRYLEAHPLASPTRQTAAGRAILSRQTEQIEDVTLEEDYAVPMAAQGSPARSLLAVPLMGKSEVMGAIVVARAEPGAFPPRHVEILRTFADQAVIAIENSRLFEEVQAKTRDLEESLARQTATADVLKLIGRSAFDLEAVLNTLIGSAKTLCAADFGTICLREGDYFHAYAAAGVDPAFLAALKAKPQHIDDRSLTPRVGRTGRIEHIPDQLLDPDYQAPQGTENVAHPRTLLGVPLLREGRVEATFVLMRTEYRPFAQKDIELAQTFADQAIIAIGNVRLFDEVQARTRELEQSLADLRKTQDRLVQSEKLASLGQLTAGIAHEIKNPLNFVNNFAALSRELLDEMKETLAPAPLEREARAEVDELMGLLDSNLEKVAHHGKRADSIVKNMLLHSREGSGERARVDVNAMIEEALNLGYHGARAEKPGFNVTIEKHLAPDAGDADLYLQEMTRVLLNLVSNGFYATAKRKQEERADYQPTLIASTRSLGERVEIRVRDNGGGIPAEVRAKMFNPFFTTKPAGEGTGLGLSLSHDIVVKQHAGTIDVETEHGSFTEFVITLPRESAKA